MIIDIFHDTACPWCRIGKRHLEIALESWSGEPVQVSYRSFFLNPTIPPEGYEFEQYMLAKGGGRIPLEISFLLPVKWAPLWGWNSTLNPSSGRRIQV
jgi:predicted DsbA family dithiol-disulfide isomerase